jgi:hypothetical protein
VRDLLGIVLLDLSASTSDWNTLTMEKALVREFGYLPTVAWQHTARLVTTMEQVDLLEPEGGTTPACMYHSPEVVNSLLAAKVAVFTTDGVIGPDCINALYLGANRHFGHLTLIVCLVVGPLPADQTDDYWPDSGGVDVPPARPAELDNSVFSSLASYGQVIFGHLNHGVIRVLQISESLAPNVASQCNVKALTKEQLDRASWDDLPRITVPQLKALVVPVNDAPELPPGYGLLPDGTAIHLSAMLKMKELDTSLVAVLSRYLPMVILHAHHTDRLAHLYEWLTRCHAPVKWLADVHHKLREDTSSFCSSSSMSSYMSQSQ